MIDIRSDFIRYLKNKDLAESSIERYVTISGYLQRYVQENYNARFEDDAVKGYMVSNWESSLQRLKYATRSQYILIANTFLKYLYLMQYTDRDLSEVLTKPKSLEKHYKLHPEEFTEKTGYTPEEISAMMNAEYRCKKKAVKMRAMIATFVSSGLRVAELSSLNVGDLQSDSEFVMVARKGTHGNKVKAVIPFEARPFIKEYLNSREEEGEELISQSPLFTSNRGNRMSPHAIYTEFARLQKSLGIHTGVHTFRHTALTAAAKCANPVVSRDFAGQKHITVTDRYLHSTDQEIASAASSIAQIFTSLTKQTST